MTKRTLVFAFLIGITTLQAANADTITGPFPNLVVNGGFETGNFSGWQTANLEKPYSAVISTVSPYYGNISPHGGHSYASLSDDYTAGILPGHGQVAEISQTIITVPGVHYTLSFWADIETAANYVRSPGLVFQAYWNSTQLLSIINPPKSVDGWVQYQYSLIGTGRDTITFYGANVPRYNGLDDVSLIDPPTVTTPLPGTFTMCGIAGVLGMGVATFRRRLVTKT